MAEKQTQPKDPINLQAYFDHTKSDFWPHAKVVRIVKKKWLIYPIFITTYGLGILSAIYLLFTILNIASIPFISDLPLSNAVAGLSSIIISVALLALSFHIYYRSAVEEPEPKLPLEEAHKAMDGGERFNLGNYASVASLLTIDYAIKASNTKDKTMIPASFVYEAFTKEERGIFVIQRLGFSTDDFLKRMREYYKKNQSGEPTINTQIMFQAAMNIAYAQYHSKILVSDVLAALSLFEPFFKDLLFERNIKFEDVMNIVYWQSTNEKVEDEKKFNPDRLKLTGGIGKDWAAGYTLALNQFGKDLTEIVARQQSPVHLIGRRQETVDMEKILIRAAQHNVLLVGPSGVGKSTIVLNFARNVLFGQTYKALANRKIIELNIDYLLAGAQTPGDIINRLQAVLTDAVLAGNVILYINNVHTLFQGNEQRVGAIDASDVLIPYLEHPGLFFIATTTSSAFHQFIEPKSAIVDKFERITVDEPDHDSVIRILEDILHWLEPQYGVIVTYNALQKIVELTDRFIYDKSFPEKAIDLLNELVVNVKTQGRETVYPEDVEQIIQQKTNVPIGEGEDAEKERLLNLEDFLHRRVVGQETAIKAVSNAMRRARSGIGAINKPIGSFLFLGPTGVGKTETSKALADAYFGSDKRMIRFDMSEYQDISGLHRLLGAPPGTPGAQSGGQLTNAVKDSPFSLILFDEIEKADPNILNIFLQILDEGWVTDSLGRRVKFNNTIIIATSNAGSEYIRQEIQAGTSDEDLQTGLINYLQEKRLFRPEFINRFNAVINFNPLTQEQVVVITGLMLDKLAGRLEQEKGVFIRFTPEATEKLAELGFDPLLGARPISRTIEEKVENFLAKKLLSNEIKRGSQVMFDISDIE